MENSRVLSRWIFGSFRQGLMMQSSRVIHDGRTQQRDGTSWHRTIAVATGLFTWASVASAQFGNQPAATLPPKPAAEGKPAIIERAPLILRDSSRFQIPLRLEAARSVHVAARVDGVVA